MKKWFLLLSIAAVSMLGASPVPAQLTVKGKVSVADFLNVRLGPGLRHAVTGRLKAGQEVEITRIMGNWLELKAPESLKIYVSEARVNAEGKLTGELNMRSRMDVASPSYGILPKDSVVKRLDERRNGWVRIAPPETVRVYVAAICVTFDRNKFDSNGLIIREKALEAESAPEVKAEANAEKAPEVKAEAKVEKAPEAPAKAEVKTNAPSIPASASTAPQKYLSGIAVKWQYAKTPETAIAFLDQPNGKNQAFIVGKTPEVQKELQALADSGKRFEVCGDYKGSDTPQLFEVSSINVSK